MKKRTSALPILVMVAVVALVIGSFGTATASGLTKKTVKKIASKVVNKKASGLSVANSAKLNGKAPSAYQTTAYEYTLPVQAAAGSRTYTFGTLPDGNYLVQYSVFALMSTTTEWPICFFTETPSGNDKGLGYGQQSGFSTATSVSASTFVSATSALQFHCNGNGGPGTANFALSNSVLSTVSFIPVDIAVTGTGVGARSTSGKTG